VLTVRADRPDCVEVDVSLVLIARITTGVDLGVPADRRLR